MKIKCSMQVGLVNGKNEVPYACYNLFAIF